MAVLMIANQEFFVSVRLKGLVNWLTSLGANQICNVGAERVNITEEVYGQVDELLVQS